MVRRAARETASSMGDTPIDRLHKRACLAQRPCRLSGAEMMVAVVSRMAQLLDNGEVTGQSRRKVLAPSREFIGKRRMQAGMAPLWSEEPRGLQSDLRGLKHGIVGAIRCRIV